VSVKLVTITPDAEKIVAYCARVSSAHQDNPDYAGLLRYCVQHGHWSVFEQASATFEIETTIAVAMQMLRHKSFNPQMISRRYTSKDLDYLPVQARKQAVKNRQSSAEPCDAETQEWFQRAQEDVWLTAMQYYQTALDSGIAREQARFLLPQNTMTRLYWTGNLRSYIHWIQLRTQPDTQAEHREIAEACKRILSEHCPTIAEALGWTTK
jgi:thymidylate synthase (FAD)